jgi:hypothetical protein
MPRPRIALVDDQGIGSGDHVVDDRIAVDVQFVQRVEGRTHLFGLAEWVEDIDIVTHGAAKGGGARQFALGIKHQHGARAADLPDRRGFAAETAGAFVDRLLRV